MAGIKYNHNMFTVGMISQKIQGNTESETYNNSLLDCKNFYIRQTGGVFKRPGTIHVDVAKDSLRMKLFPFNFSGDNSIVLGFQAGIVFAYNTEGLVAQCIAGSLDTEVINDEHFTPIQNGDTVYLFTKVGIFEVKFNTEEKTLTFAEKKFTFAPVGKVNDIKTNTATYSNGVITLTGNATFKSSDKKQRILLLWERPVDPEDTEIRYLYQTSLVYSYFDITDVTSDTTATVTWDKNYASFGDESKIPSGATFRFALPAFGADRGYPIAAGILSNRLFLADKDLMILGSRTSFDDLFDFTLGSDETCSLSYRMNNDVGTISWIVGQDKLFVGTPTGIYASGGSGVYAEEIIAPGNFSLRKFSSVHAGTLLPTAINATIVFTDALSKNVYEISVDETVGVYKTFDLSLLSNELLNSGCVSHAWSSYPVKTYWVACKDGTLASMTYEKANNVLAWSYHDLGGENSAVESVASIQINGYDYVFLVVRRTHDGEIIRKVEYIDKLYEPLDHKQYQQHYADSGLVVNYNYAIQNIQQYKSPQISFQDTVDPTSPFSLFVQNENSKNQYIKCIFWNTNSKVTKDIYVEKAYQTQGGDEITSYVSFCALQEKTEHLAPDGRDLVTYIQQPLDTNVFKIYESNLSIGVMAVHIDRIDYRETERKLILICDSASIPAFVQNIVLNGTGIKDGNGNDLDTDTDNVKSLPIIGRDVSAYTPDSGIIIDMPNGYTDGSYDPNGLREIYSVVQFNTAPTFNVGSNAIVEQQADLATAVALGEISTIDPTVASPGCRGIIWDNTNNVYVVMYNGRIYNVNESWTNWNECSFLGALTTKLSYVPNVGYSAFKGSYRYFSADCTFSNRATGSIPKLSNFFGIGKDGTYGVAIESAGEKLYRLSGSVSVWTNTVEKSMSSYHIGKGTPRGLLFNDSAIVANAKILLANTDSGSVLLSQVKADTLEEIQHSTIEHESREVNAIIPIGEQISDQYTAVYLVGDGGLIYKGDPLTLEFELIQNQDHMCNWKGGISYQSETTTITFLYSKDGELLKIVEPSGQPREYYYQHVQVTSDITNIFYTNHCLFICLQNGNILRSISDSSWTQPCFNTQFILIDDVVGLEGINGTKYEVRNANTAQLATEGFIKYELWSNGYPLDTRPLGVYDTTVSNNGKAYVYFNTIVGLNSLINESVTVSLDGNFLKEFKVSSGGTISFGDDIYGMEAHVGYKYTSALELMPLSGGNVRGSSVGSVGSQKSAFARLYYALGGKYGTEADKMYPIGYPTALFKSSYDKVVELFTGIIELPLMNPRDYRERKFRLEQSEPVCFNVLSIAQDAEISDA